MFDLNLLLPHGLDKLLNYRKRFRSLNLPSTYSLFREYRNAIEGSLIEMLPMDARKELKLVIDVGANLGSWCSAIALLTKAKKIIAYEPDPDIFSQLQQNIQRFPNILCKNIALGSSVKKVSFNVERMHQLSSMLTISNEGRNIHGISQDNSKQITVSMTTLDNDLKEYDEISLLKIDVQGYEHEVLLGAKEVINKTKVLMIEVHYHPYYKDSLSFEDLWGLIRSIAPMKMWGISNPHCLPSGRPVWADAVFVQKDIT